MAVGAQSDPTDAAVQVVSLYRAEDRIHPRAVAGWFANWRLALVWMTQLAFYGLAWLNWNGRQLILFDLGARRFYIGPLVLYPQDFIYLTALLIICAYALFLFTAVAGRLWCGFACPQTVYTEIFLWVEHKFEGDRLARQRLDAAPWTLRKFRQRGGKHLAWLAIGLWTGVTFVGYFTPIRTLLAELGVVLGIAQAAEGAVGLSAWEWFWVLFYGLATYGNAGFMREQVCKYMCPYARFQSAMFDKDTLIIAYDTARGEPRGARPRSMPHASLSAAGKGDCIGCGLCVQVCPTGIDIRDGLQYECIGCAACVDVCNGVMDKMEYPRGLIRFDTQNAMQAGGKRQALSARILRPRVLIYGVILLAIVSAFMASLALRTPFRVDVIRDRGALARQVEDGQIENVYRLQIMNAAESAERFRVEVDGLNGVQSSPTQTVTVDSAQARWVAIDVRVPAATASALSPGAHPVRFIVTRLGNDGATPLRVLEKSTFIIPR